MLNVVLLSVHIAAGTIALLTAAFALSTAKGGANHVRAGRVYAMAMTAVFITAVPLALLGADIFLLFIAFFSFYMVFAGWRFARNRHGHPRVADWAAVAIMALTGLGMEAFAVILALNGDDQWVTLVIFGFIAFGLALADAIYYRNLPANYVRRISRHLTNMMAGTIATVTAVLVVNVATNPAWIAWILPTVVITPLIVWWNFRVARRGR